MHTAPGFSMVIRQLVFKGNYFQIFHLASSCPTVASTVNQSYRLIGSLPAQLLTNHRNLSLNMTLMHATTNTSVTV